jgi:REP element-mobilizing transposase RayT
MPRRPRIVFPGVLLHLIQQGINRQACFYADDDYRFYLEWLRTYARDAGCHAITHKSGSRSHLWTQALDLLSTTFAE